MFRVLVLGDDPATAETVVAALRSAGGLCDTADLDLEGLALGRLYDYDLVVLDLVKNGGENAAIVRRMSIWRAQTPALVLAPLDERLRALGMTAENCLPKPFTAHQLVARLRDLLGSRHERNERVVRTGLLEVKLENGIAEVAGRRLHLTAKEYGLLELLSRRKGETLTKEFLLEHLYRGPESPELKIIDVFVCKLRKKLAAATGGESYIETDWGRGYVLRDPAGAQKANGAQEAV
ncbi:MAG: response regulator transcription factor [Rhodospirillales bacterium]|nr:response regulator transcription factor [Rhodospirillales bacterium]